ncbi:MAG: HDOD domain-containing protein [Rhizobacter sp.]
MVNWLRRVSGILSHETKPTPRPSEMPPAPAATDAEAAAQLPDPDTEVFDWLLEFAPDAPSAGDTIESHWLTEVDLLIATDKGRGELLPRAAGLIPQLLNTLRDDNYSSTDLAERMGRDANLVAELMRLANSTAFRRREPVTDLADAVRRVGTGGVRQAIAKVVLKPMFDAQAGTLSGRAAPHLWQHSQAQADLCRAIAVSREMDPFEAYLGGLLGNIGWTAGLRALERVMEQHPAPAGTGFSDAFKQGFRLRRDRLFVQFVTGWRLNPALHEAARDVQFTGSFELANDPLAQVLLAGERLAGWRALGHTEADPLLTGWPDNVRRVYGELR